MFYIIISKILWLSVGKKTLFSDEYMLTSTQSSTLCQQRKEHN